MSSKRSRWLLTLVATLALATLSAPAAEPPGLLNYQGVLRDASDTPLDGAYEMVFEFWSSSTGGSQILLDRHLTGAGEPVTVSDGLFSAALGSGSVIDGTGGGTYSSLSEVFRDYGSVYLQIVIEGESLTPRVQILSAGYALNADHLDGKQASEFIDTTSNQTKYGTLALNADGATYGLEATGGSGGAFFADSNGTGRAYVAKSHLGIDASGSEGGGFFEDSDGTSLAEVAVGDIGVEGRGESAGGFFQDLDHSGNAFVGKHELGIEARGNSAGGFFLDNDSSGYAYVGAGDLGIHGFGSLAGAHFVNTVDSGLAYLGYGHTGVRGGGESTGGYFYDSNSSGYAHVGQADYGINAGGHTAGAYLKDSDSTGEAWVGYSNYGIYASGSTAGGYFDDKSGSGLARVGYGDRGIWARGNFAGGTFSHPDGETFWADVARSDGYKIRGTGVVSFVQNHPFDPERVIVYAAPEGDEVAVYTRGTARLVAGEARVPLGETFRWVANPDIGLTAHVTPKGEWTDLYVRSVSTRELVVASREGRSDTAFDYIIYGLRLGFEELGIVREKERDAFPPAAETIQSAYLEHPELRGFNAFERFREMGRIAGGEAEVDLSGTRTLLAALEQQRGVGVPPVREKAPVRPETETEIPETTGRSEKQQPAKTHQPAWVSATDQSRDLPEKPRHPADGDGNVYGLSFRPEDPDLAILRPVSEAVEAGDVVVLDAERPGLLRRSYRSEDEAVFGIVTARPGVVLGSGPAPEGAKSDSPSNSETHQAVDSSLSEIERLAPVAFTGVTLCKVDAGYGSIAAGDLLVTSPTPGHAMRASENRPGTILGKAIESLETGTALLAVLVILR